MGVIVPGPGITLTEQAECSIHFHGVVSLHPDGSVTIAEGKTLPDAALAFWEAVNEAFPGFLVTTKNGDIPT